MAPKQRWSDFPVGEQGWRTVRSGQKLAGQYTVCPPEVDLQLQVNILLAVRLLVLRLVVLLLVHSALH